MKLIQLFIINVILTSSLFAQYDIHLVKELKKELQLEEDLLYEFFISDSKYLLMTEFYTKKLIIVNLETFTISEMKWEEGRGPHEIGSIAGIDIIDSTLFIYDLNNIKFIRLVLNDMKYLEDLMFKKQIHFFKSLSNIAIGVTTNPGFGSYKQPYLNEIDWATGNSTPLSWTDWGKSPEMTENNFSGYYLLNKKFFVRVGNRMSHLFVADFENELLSEHTYDEPYKKPDSFNPTSGNLTQVLYFYIHDAELGAKNKLYLLAEGRTKNRAFKKDELTILDVETLQYEEETIKLPKAFTNMVITDKYFIGFSKEDYTLGFYRYE